jgi:predicted GIY-YIG superfamily endonuclease
MSFWVYILRCSDGSYYTGHTENLEKRIGMHKSGEITGYTSSKLPIKLVFSEEFPSREEALVSERRIKGWSRKKKEALIKGNWNEISKLAQRKLKDY